MTVGEATALIVALTGVASMVLAHYLAKRGERNDAKQEAAAAKIQERITAFDELESLNDRLTTEVNRLRDLVGEAETRGDLRLAQQAGRCRERIDELMAAVATLQSVVLSEVAKASARDVADRARRHVETDHPADDQPDL